MRRVAQWDRPASWLFAAKRARQINAEDDALALVQHVAANPELISLIRADDVKLRAYVKGLGLAAALPGVRVFEDRVMSARAA